MGTTHTADTLNHVHGVALCGATRIVSNWRFAETAENSLSALRSVVGGSDLTLIQDDGFVRIAGDSRAVAALMIVLGSSRHWAVLDEGTDKPSSTAFVDVMGIVTGRAC